MKKQSLSQYNQLLNLGTDLPKKVNPISYYNPTYEKYKNIWTNYDINQCCSRFVWENLPNGLTSWNLERMLYFRGSLAGFLFGGNFYILPYAITGEINPYGLPIAIRPITFNGQAVGGDNSFFGKDFTLPINISGDLSNNYGAVILYDSVPYSPSGSPISRFSLNQIVIKDIADTMARININIVVSNKKIILIIKDANQRQIVEKELEAGFSSDCPFIIATSELDVKSVQSSNDFNADDLFNVIKNYDSIRCFMNSISAKNFGIDKKERLISAELDDSDEQINLVADIYFDLRKEFCEKCNAQFGTNISVKKRADIYSENLEDLENGIEEEVEINEQ